MASHKLRVVSYIKPASYELFLLELHVARGKLQNCESLKNVYLSLILRITSLAS